MSTSDLIQPTHLQRRAVIYVRQSSPSQVINNQESTRLQYALKKRAIERGWHERDTFVIDTDRTVLDVIHSEISMSSHADKALAVLKARPAA